MTTLDEAVELYRKARQEKREYKQHKDLNRTYMEQLRLMCEKYGIPLEIVKKEA